MTKNLTYTLIASPDVYDPTHASYNMIRHRTVETRIMMPMAVFETTELMRVHHKKMDTLCSFDGIIFILPISIKAKHQALRVWPYIPLKDPYAKSYVFVSMLCINYVKRIETIDNLLLRCKRKLPGHSTATLL